MDIRSQKWICSVLLGIARRFLPLQLLGQHRLEIIMAVKGSVKILSAWKKWKMIRCFWDRNYDGQLNQQMPCITLWNPTGRAHLWNWLKHKTDSRHTMTIQFSLPKAVYYWANRSSRTYNSQWKVKKKSVQSQKEKLQFRIHTCVHVKISNCTCFTYHLALFFSLGWLALFFSLGWLFWLIRINPLQAQCTTSITESLTVLVGLLTFQEQCMFKTALLRWKFREIWYALILKAQKHARVQDVKRGRPKPWIPNVQLFTQQTGWHSREQHRTMKKWSDKLACTTKHERMVC